MHRQCCLPVHYTTSCKHSLVLLRMGKIIARNMLSWLKLLIKLLLLHLFGCLFYHINDARSHKHQIVKETFVLNQIHSGTFHRPTFSFSMRLFLVAIIKTLLLSVSFWKILKSFKAVWRNYWKDFQNIFVISFFFHFFLIFFLSFYFRKGRNFSMPVRSWPLPH